jgi:uncharacterized protein with ParB-like and HNH nuclease domain
VADNALQTGNKFIRALFQGDQFYNIPEYQRPYVWGADQINTLLEDITSAMDHDRNREYFLGCMIWNVKVDKTGDMPYTYNDILDGQQRFITLYLLQAVIRDISTYPKVKETVTKRLRQERDDLEGTPERNRLKFTIRQDDAFFQEHVLTEGGTKKINKLISLAEEKNTATSIRNMAIALQATHEWWASKSDEFDTEEDFQQYIYEFYGYLGNKVLLLFLSTSDNLDDAYNLFTVLNSRGLQLQSGDILRAQNLRVIQDENVRKKCAALWDDCQSVVMPPYKSFDEFLWAMIYILMKYRSDDNLSISKAFSFIYDDRKSLPRGKPTFDFIGKYAGHLEAVFNTNHQVAEAGFLYENLNYILATTYGNQYIVLLMHYRECFGEFNILDFLIKIDNLFSLAWLTDARNQQTRIFILLRKMEEIRGLFSDKQAGSIAFLKEPSLYYDYQGEKANTALSLDKFILLLDKEKWGSYAGARINKTRYLLLKLDLLVGNLNNKLQFNKAFASVEHIMPQKAENTHWNVSEDTHKEWLHRLGNIVLVDKKKNASLSNSPFADKKYKYSTYIEGRANTNHVFITYQHWDEVTLQKNHDRVVGLLRAYYTGNSFQTLKDIKKKSLQIPLASLV